MIETLKIETTTLILIKMINLMEKIQDRDKTISETIIKVISKDKLLMTANQNQTGLVHKKNP